MSSNNEEGGEPVNGGHAQKLSELNESAVTSFNQDDIEVAYANLKKAETILEVKSLLKIRILKLTDWLIGIMQSLCSII
jgi:hypothetical protein